ncbi:MAG: hypothetical protein RR907_15705, partial [Comamonas sp.]
LALELFKSFNVNGHDFSYEGCGPCGLRLQPAPYCAKSRCAHVLRHAAPQIFRIACIQHWAILEK